MIRTLCLGDSNTYGYDPRSYLGGRYPKTARWTGLLEQSGRRVFNCGENGASVPRAGQMPSAAALVRSFLPLQEIVVMLGSNDLLEGASPEETGARMEALLRCLRDSAPEAQLMLVAPPPMAEGTWVTGPELIRRSVELAAVYRALAEKLGVAFADAGAWGIVPAFDGVHFLPEGHGAFAAGLLAALDTTGG